MWAGMVGLFATIFFVQRQQKRISAAIPHAPTKLVHHYTIEFLISCTKICENQNKSVSK